MLQLAIVCVPIGLLIAAFIGGLVAWGRSTPQDDPVQPDEPRQFSADLEQKLARTGCWRERYYTDKCGKHNSWWPYDERGCNAALSNLGFPSRRFLGDGRASGRPVSV